MAGLDLDRLTKLAEALAVAFYVLMALAFISAVTGTPGAALLLLVLGASAHVARCGLEDVAGKPSPRGSR